MKTSTAIGFKLLYNNPSTGETEQVYAQKTVPIENYSAEWYAPVSYTHLYPRRP